MCEETVQKMLEIIQKQKRGVFIKKKGKQEMITFGYNHKTKKFSAKLLRFFRDGTSEVNNAFNLTTEQIIRFITNPEFEDEINVFCSERIKREERYEKAKRTFVKEIEDMRVSDKQKEYMKSVICRVCQLHEYVGDENSIPIKHFNGLLKIIDTLDYTGLDRGMELHIIGNGVGAELQNDDIGPRITISGLVSEINSGRLILDFEPNSKEKEVGQ